MTDDPLDTAAFEAWRAEMNQGEQADLTDSPDLQDAVRQSSARQTSKHSFATNEGIVILMSPADLKRLALSDQLQGSINRSRMWGEPNFLGSGQHALHGRGK